MLAGLIELLGRVIISPGRENGLCGYLCRFLRHQERTPSHQGYISPLLKQAGHKTCWLAIKSCHTKNLGNNSLKKRKQKFSKVRQKNIFHKFSKPNVRA
jgi:hypothetical protein